LTWTVAITLTILWMLLFWALKFTAWPVHLLLAAAAVAAAGAMFKKRRA
jgi:uncharacterized protein DUF5670